MLNHSALKILVSAALLATSMLSGSAHGLEFTEPQYAVHDRSLALTAAALNATLTDYAYTQLPSAQASVRDQALTNYLSGMGLRHLWQVMVDGTPCDAWYSPEADVSVVVARRTDAQGLVSVEAFTVPGRMQHRNLLL